MGWGGGGVALDGGGACPGIPLALDSMGVALESVGWRSAPGRVGLGGMGWVGNPLGVPLGGVLASRS